MFWSDFKRYICENLLKVTLHLKLVTFTLLHYNMAQFNTASSLAINCTLVQKKKPKKTTIDIRPVLRRGGKIPHRLQERLQSHADEKNKQKKETFTRSVTLNSCHSTVNTVSLLKSLIISRVSSDKPVFLFLIQSQTYCRSKITPCSLQRGLGFFQSFGTHPQCMDDVRCLNRVYVPYIVNRACGLGLCSRSAYEV